MSLVLTVFQHASIVLDELAQAAHKIDPSLGLTGQAFKQRFNAFAVEFLKAMFAEALKLNSPMPTRLTPMLEAFSAVYLLDASHVRLPDSLADSFPGTGGVGVKAAAKVYLLVNYLTGAYETLRIEKARQPDQSMGEKFLTGLKAGALWMFDLGFFNASFLAAIADASSFFVSTGGVAIGLLDAQRSRPGGATGFRPAATPKPARVV